MATRRVPANDARGRRAAEAGAAEHIALIGPQVEIMEKDVDQAIDLARPLGYGTLAAPRRRAHVVREPGADRC